MMYLRPFLKKVGLRLGGSIGGFITIERPFSVRELLYKFDVITHRAVITSGGLAALGGSVTVEVRHDGTLVYHWAAHDSGMDSYSFRVTALLSTPDGRVIASTWGGHVGGTFSTDKRDESLTEVITDRKEYVSAKFESFRDARLELIVDYSSDIGTAVKDFADLLIKGAIGSLAITPTMGALLFVGGELASLATTGKLAPGSRVIAGMLCLAGPYGTLFALAAEGIASLTERQRYLTPDEYAWAQRVFKGSLPPSDKITLTDTIGAQDRAFVLLRATGKISMNLGKDGFADPIKYRGSSGNRPEGEVFVHELVHVWQYHWRRGDPLLLTDALVSKVCELWSDPYQFDPGRPFGDYNLEQQASIIAAWYAANADDLESPKARAHPGFRYVEQNIRQGAPG